MMNKIKKMIKNERGMTLIELLAVIVIIAIIALIAIPAIGNIINNSHDKAIISSAANIMEGAKLARTDGACTAACTKENLADYVEGEDGVYSVAYSDGVYTVTYDKLSTIKGKKLAEFKGDSITSEKIREAMKK
ncbi:hypothetical protein BK130_01335 [Viridibacillus sp. FSL H8-0123]|nr:hypothetical protein BK130_01335 [Viridibacillus sp. FSL H8-0123]